MTIIAQGGYAEDLNNIYFKSKMERNFARYLQWLKGTKQIIEWGYETDRFEFKGIRSGTVYYKPDFKVLNNNGTIVYYETKGYMDRKSKTKLKRMAKYHPDITIIVIQFDEYKAIRDYKKLIPNWED